MSVINDRFEVRDIRGALSELNALSLDEYGLTLEQVLLDPSPISPLRLQRLTGIVLKRPFALKSGAPAFTTTGARAAWPWADAAPDVLAATAKAELAVMNELRMPGPWNERKPFATGTADFEGITWDQFKEDVEHERGLFKVLALYVNDKVRQTHGRSFKEYLETGESKHFEAGLDLATLVFDAAVTAPIASVVGIPTVAVGVALVAIQFGYRTFTDPNADRQGDRAN